MPPLQFLTLIAVLFSGSGKSLVSAIQISGPIQRHNSHNKFIPWARKFPASPMQNSRVPSEIRSAVNAKDRQTSLSPLFNSRSENDDDSGAGTTTTRLVPYIAPWARAMLIFGLGYGIGGASAPGWQRQSRVASKIGVTRIALAVLICRDVWRTTPKWVKPRVTRYARKLINVLLFWRSVGESDNEVDENVDVDDITDLSNLSTKIQRLVDVATTKLELEDGGDSTKVASQSEESKVRDDFNIQASFLALFQLMWQVKSQRANSRDEIYRASGTKVPDEMLEGMDDMFELADLAYDEHKDGEIKQVLKGMGYNLIKHDTTAVPGYTGHYIALNSDFSKEKTAVIGVKGTSNFEDFLTDLCASSVQYNLTHPFYDGGSNTLRCHEGVYISSQRLFEELLPVVKNLLIPSGYKITIVGHSLGAGCATLLAMMLRASIPSLQESNKQLKVWAFASPPVLDLSSALACSPFVTTVVNNCDIIPRANISPFAVTVRVMRAVNKRLTEKNLSMSDFKSTLAFLNKIGEGSDGEMLMDEDELAAELDVALERTDLRDPDHLYVPGKVVVMYDLWEKEQNRMQKQQTETEKDFTNILKDWMQTVKKADVHSSDVDLSNISTAEEAILCDGTCKALRYIELDGRLIDDHMAPNYRSSIANILSSRNSTK